MYPIGLGWITTLMSDIDHVPLTAGVEMEADKH